MRTPTEAQIAANRANAEKSTGPVTESGKAASSQNRGAHYLTNNCTFRVLPDEDEVEFGFSICTMARHHNVQGDGQEYELIVRMAEHEWMRRRALRFLDKMFNSHPEYMNPYIRDDSSQFSVMMRYQTMHERAFYNALNMLVKLRKEKAKEEIGFERKIARADAEERRKQSHLSSEKAKQVATECKIVRVLCASANNPDALSLAQEVKTRHQAA